MATTASYQQGGVATFWRENNKYCIEIPQCTIRPNIITFQIISGKKRVTESINPSEYTLVTRKMMEIQFLQAEQFPVPSCYPSHMWKPLTTLWGYSVQ